MSVIDDIVNSSYDEYDLLPVSAKLLLATRLLASVGNDMANVRSRFWHEDRTADVPRIIRRHGLVGEPHAEI